eukprot:m.249697 g.249697  ORF g.249697 m.249697 type:complete len:129 (-) comp19527_c0_seq19:328-714(-)
MASAGVQVCGGTPRPPPPSPPSHPHYNCTHKDGQPVCEAQPLGRNGTFVNLDQCSTECNRTFTCRHGECVARMDGKGQSLEYCMTECAKPEQMYICKDETCVEVDGTGVIKEVCENVCNKSSTKPNMW